MSVKNQLSYYQVAIIHYTLTLYYKILLKPWIDLPY